MRRDARIAGFLHLSRPVLVIAGVVGRDDA